MCESIARCVLIILNIVIAVIGLAFATFGGLLTWAKPLTEKLVKKGLELVKQYANNLDEETVNNVIKQVIRIAAPVGIAIFVCGLVLLLVTIIGFVGVCCHIKIALFVYAAIFGVLVLAHLALIIYYYAKKDEIKAKVSHIMRDLVYQYESISSKKVESLVLSVLMPTLKCCGYENGNDFKQKPPAMFTGIEEINGKSRNVDYPVPCCKNVEPTIGSCPFHFTSDNSYINDGCKKPWDEMIVNRLDIIVGFSFIVLGINIAIIVFAVLAK